MVLRYEWRGDVGSAELEALHAEGFVHEPTGRDWETQLEAHSLGWVCARDDGDLVGFVNVAWDGGTHAFILDTVVASGFGRLGIGTALVGAAADGAEAAGCQWLHVDFPEHLKAFYLEACGFEPTMAGLMRLGD